MLNHLYLENQFLINWLKALLKLTLLFLNWRYLIPYWNLRQTQG